MAIANLFTWFAPDLAEMVSEAVERAGIAAIAAGNDLIESCLRSCRLLLNSEWLTLGMREWQYELDSYTTITGDSSFTLPPEVLTIADAVLIRSGRATPINPIARTEYLEIPDKTQQGRPDRYFCDRQYNQVVVNYWRAAENNTDVIQYWAWKVDSLPGNQLQYQLSLPPHVMEAFIAGLAAKLAMKHNVAKFQMLQEYYRGADPNPRNVGGVLALALDADRGSGDVRITISRRRRRR